MLLANFLDARARRLLAGVISGMAGRFATLIAPLFATPAMLHYFGDADFGLWATSISTTSIAVIADLGIGNGLLTRAAAALGNQQFGEIRRYLASAYAAMGVIAAGLLALAASVVAIWHPSPIVIGVFVTFILGIPGTVFYQFLYGVQKVPTSNAVLSLGAVASVSLCLIAVHLALPFWLVVVAYAMPSALTPYVGAIWFFWRRPRFRPGLRDIDWNHGHDLLRLGSGFFLLSILTAVGMNIDNLIISANLGPETVTGYSITTRLGSLLGLVITALFMPLWGASGEALAKGDNEWVRRSAARMSVIGVGLVSTAGVLLIVASDAIMTLWVGRTFPDQHLLLAAIVTSSAVIAATSPYNMVLNAMGRAAVQIWPWLAFVALSVGAKLLVVGTGQVWLIAATTGAVYALTVMPTIFVLARRLLSDPQEQPRTVAW